MTFVENCRALGQAEPLKKNGQTTGEEAMKKKRGGGAPPTPAQSQAQEPSSPPSGLVQRLLAGLRRRQQAAELPPAGQRSGEGSKSLAPYLEQARSSRPAPLE